jgi:hypothetical protein
VVLFFVAGSITCAAYPLEQIDTIDIETGNISKNSALNLFVFGVRDTTSIYFSYIYISNLVLKTMYPVVGFYGFPQTLYTNAGMVP